MIEWIKNKERGIVLTAIAAVILIFVFYFISNPNITGFSVYEPNQSVNEVVILSFDEARTLYADSVVSVNLGESYDAKTLAELVYVNGSISVNEFAVDLSRFDIVSPSEAGEYELSVSLIVNDTLVDRIRINISVSGEEINISNISTEFGGNETSEGNMSINDTDELNPAINETADFNETFNISEEIINETGIEGNATINITEEMINESAAVNDSTTLANETLNITENISNETANITEEITNETTTEESVVINETIIIN
jgi:hypothetical protein